MEKCENCRFSHFPKEDEDMGTCKRNAPRPKAVNEITSKIFWMWPRMCNDEWCGEYEPQGEDNEN